MEDDTNAIVLFADKPGETDPLKKVLEDLGVSSSIPVDTQHDEFDFPTNQLDCFSDPTSRTNHLPRELEYVPSYLRVCYEEFTRKFFSVSIGLMHNSAGHGQYQAVSSLRYPDLDSNSALPTASTRLSTKPLLPPFMQQLNPGFNNPTSTFRFVPPDTRHHLGNIPNGDLNIMLKVGTRKELSEPLFASFGLFWVTESHAVRISEFFRCDLCDDEVRKKYNELYFYMSQGNTINRVDPATLQKTCLFNIPSNGIRKQDIYLVCFVHKVLVGENHVGPYIRGSYGGLPVSDAKFEEAWRRLKLYRQQLGFGVLRLFDEKIMSTGQQATNVPIPMYATRSSLNDQLLGSYIRDLFFEKVANRANLEFIEVDIRLTLCNLGTDNQAMGVLQKRYPNVSSFQILPAQFCGPSGTAAIESWEGSAITSESSKGMILRRVAYLTPREIEATIQNLSAGLSIRRQLRMGVDNTLYVYPTQLDRFRNRNICVKIELLEFENRVLGYPDAGQTYTVLCNLYNTLNGPLFVTALFSTVWYHNKSPMCCDEFKIRLPYVVTDRHFIRFTAQQINVNRDKGTNRISILGRMGFVNNQEEHELETAIILGVGYLSLQDRSGMSATDGGGRMYGGDALLPLLQDKEHTITFSTPKDFQSPEPGSVNDAEDRRKSKSRRQSSVAQPTPDVGPAPFLKVTTRAVSSFASTCSRVQRVLAKPPLPLGELPKSTVHMNHHDFASEFTYEESILARNINDLSSAAALEINNHFLVLMRILIRSLCGGNGVYSEDYVDPYYHTPLRCVSFLVILQMLARICPELTNQQLFSSANTSNLYLSEVERHTDNEVLQAYIDYIFDEEVPLTISKGPRPNSATRVSGGATSGNTSKSDEGASSKKHGFAMAASPWASAMSSMAKEAAEVVTTRQNVAAIYAETARQQSARGIMTPSDIADAVTDDDHENSVDISTDKVGADDAASEEGTAGASSNEEINDRSLSNAAVNALNDSGDEPASDTNSEDNVNLLLPPTGSNRNSYNSTNSIQNSIKPNRIVLPRQDSDRVDPHSSIQDDEDEDDGVEYEVGSPSEDKPNEIQISARKSSVGGGSGGSGVGLAPIRAHNEAGAASINFNDISYGPTDENGEALEGLDEEGGDVDITIEDEEQLSGDGVVGAKAGDDGNNKLAGIIHKAVHSDNKDHNGATNILDDIIAKAKEEEDAEAVARSEESWKAYEDYVSEHWVLQLERLVVEMEIAAAVNAVVAELDESVKKSFESDSALQSLFDKFNFSSSCNRWWNDLGVLSTPKKPPKGEQTAQSMKQKSAKSVADEPNDITAPNTSPFDVEGFWFNFLDSQAPGGRGDSIIIGPNTVAEAGVILSKPAPFYESIAGYSQRKQAIIAAAKAAEESARAQVEVEDRQHQETPGPDESATEASEGGGAPISVSTKVLNRTNSAFSVGSDSNGSLSPSPKEAPDLIYVRRTNTPVHTHWWPWVYEVVVYQWLSLLKYFHNKPAFVVHDHCNAYCAQAQIPTNKKYFNVDTRVLLTDKSPILLRLILKSLISRIIRDGRHSPVILDTEFFSVLCELLSELVLESSQSNTAGRAKLIITAVSQFLRHLFAFVVPAQMQILIGRCMENLELKGSDDEIDRRLSFLDEIVSFEYLLSASMPLVPDVNKDLIGKYLSHSLSRTTHNSPPTPMTPLTPLTSASSMMLSPSEEQHLHVNTSAGARGESLLSLRCVLDGFNVVPRPHWLADLVVSSCMKIYKRPSGPGEESSIRRASSTATNVSISANSNTANSALQALRILADVFTNTAFDQRYQAQSVRQRLALMFWPLFYELLDEMNNVSLKAYETIDRKQILAMMVTILQDTPDDIVRDQLRKLTICVGSYTSKLLLPYAYSVSSGSNSLSTRRPSYAEMTPLSAVHRSTSAASNASYMSNQSGGSGAGSDSNQRLPTSNRLWYFVHFLHLVLESFAVNSVVYNTISSSTAGILTSASAASLSSAQMGRRNSDNAPPAGAAGPAANAKLNLFEKNRAARTAVAAGAGNAESDNIKSHVKAKNQWQQPTVARIDPRLAALNAGFSSGICVTRLAQLLLQECPRLLYPNSAEIFLNNSAEETAFIAAQAKTYEGFLSSVMFVVLHALSTPQEQEVYVQLLNITNTAIASWGAKLFSRVVGDTMQDWIRIILRGMSVGTSDEDLQHEYYQQAPTVTTATVTATMLTSPTVTSLTAATLSNESAATGVLPAASPAPINLFSALSSSALQVLSTLLKSQYIYFGSITVIADIILAVFDDFIEGKLNWFGGNVHTHEDEEALLAPFLRALGHLKLESQSSLRSDTADVKFRPYHAAVIALMQNVELLVFAHGQLRKFVVNHLMFDWLGTNMLDDLNNRTIQMLSEFHKKRQLCSMNYSNKELASGGVPAAAIPGGGPASSQSPPQLSGAPRATKSILTSNTDVYELMELLARAAAVFDPIRLPRQRIWWLENLAHLQGLRSNRVEGGEIRWQIFTIMEGVKQTWQTQWAPRHPLEFGTNTKTVHTTFLSALQAAMAAHPQPARAWQSVAQHTSHMESCLSASYDRFIPDMLYLAERSAKKLLDIYKSQNKLEAMHNLFLKVHNSFKENKDNRDINSIMPVGGNSKFGGIVSSLGSFYWVQYRGKQVPARFQKEFVYRFTPKSEGGASGNAGASELGASLVIIVKGQVAPSTAVTVATYMQTLQQTSSGKDIDNNDGIVIVVTPVTPISSGTRSPGSKFLKYDFEGKFSMNQTRQFKLSTRLSDLKKDVRLEEDYVDTIIVSVKECFPFVSMRQTVIAKECKRITPIEVVTEDMEARVELLKDLINDKTPDAINRIREALESMLRFKGPGGGAYNPAQLVRVFLKTELPPPPPELDPVTPTGGDKIPRPKSALNNNGNGNNASNARLMLTSRFSGEFSPGMIGATEPVVVADRPSVSSLPLSLASTAGRVVAPGSPLNPQSINNMDGSFVFNGNSSKYNLIVDQKALELKRKFKLILFEYLSKTKALLAKCRKILITDAGLDDTGSNAGGGAGGGAAGGGLHDNASTTSIATATASTLYLRPRTHVQHAVLSTGSTAGASGGAGGGGGSITNSTGKGNTAAVDAVAVRQGMVAPTPPMEQHTVAWQTDLERQYDTVVENTLPFLTEVEGARKLYRDANINSYNTSTAAGMGGHHHHHHHGKR